MTNPLQTLRDALGEAQKKMLVLAKWEENIHMTSSRTATPYTNGIEGIDALEAALKVAEEALVPLNEDEAFCVDPWCQADLDAGHPHKPECKWTAAMAAIKEARQ